MMPSHARIAIGVRETTCADGTRDRQPVSDLPENRSVSNIAACHPSKCRLSDQRRWFRRTGA